MAEAKTKKTDTDPKAFLERVENEQKRDDSYKLLELMEKATGEPAAMWGPSIIGFGSYHFRYDSGQEGDWPLTGFSPRKQALTLYIMPGFKRYEELMQSLGKYKTGKSCLYVKKLDDVNIDVLQELVEHSVSHMREKYGTTG